MNRRNILGRFRISSRKDVVRLLKVSAVVAIVTFYLAIFSDYSVKMYYGTISNDFGFLFVFESVTRSLVALAFMVIVVVILLLFIPPLRLTFERIFGMEDDDKKQTLPKD